MLKKRSYKHTNNALILTGGGARAAYQVGVLSAVAQFVPRTHGVPFPIINGTSAGAINATALACYASCFQLGVKKLEWVWNNLNTNHIYHSDPMRVFGHIAKGALGSFQADYANRPARSLLNNAPLRKLLNRVVDFQRIGKNISSGYLSGLSITASSYSNGDSISFYQSDDHIKPWFKANRRGEPCQINSEHLMASAAIPMVFPSINIKQQHFGDGSVHQLSPLSPAIQLGADKVFIVGVEHPKVPVYDHEKNAHPPSVSSIAGHLLDSVFSDTLQSDIERTNKMNDIIRLIPPEVRKENNGLKNIDSFLISPSHDFNKIAVEYFEELPLSIQILLRSIGVTNDSASSIVSYLLFEKNYCKQLIKLGFEDALEKETEIRRFLNL